MTEVIYTDGYKTVFHSFYVIEEYKGDYLEESYYKVYTDVYRKNHILTLYGEKELDEFIKTH